MHAAAAAVTSVAAPPPTLSTDNMALAVHTPEYTSMEHTTVFEDLPRTSLPIDAMALHGSCAVADVVRLAGGSSQPVAVS